MRSCRACDVFGSHQVRQGTQLAAMGHGGARVLPVRAFLGQRSQGGLCASAKSDPAMQLGQGIQQGSVHGAFFLLQAPTQARFVWQFQQCCQGAQRGIQRDKSPVPASSSTMLSDKSIR
jgi:hypothetical protein